MKTLRFLGMTFLMVMLAVNFTACSKDEPNSPIVGTWIGGEVGYKAEETLIFNNDGTGIWDEDLFNYTIKSNTIVFDFGDGDPETYIYSVSSNILTLTKENDGEYRFIKK